MTGRLGAHRQRGGTLGGFIAGLLLGLGCALVVAVYVTKVPVPLMDRGVQRPTTSEAVEAERLRNWNPNAGISPPAASPAGQAAAPSPTPGPAAPPAPRPAAPDPLGQLMEQQARSGPSGVAAVEAPATVDPFIYFVQAGAFRNADEAEAQRARLAMLGFQATVTEREQAGRVVFRVRLGPFDRRQDAEIMEQRVQGQSIETALVRVQR